MASYVNVFQWADTYSDHGDYHIIAELWALVVSVSSLFYCDIPS